MYLLVYLFLEFCTFNARGVHAYKTDFAQLFPRHAYQGKQQSLSLSAKKFAMAVQQGKYKAKSTCPPIFLFVLDSKYASDWYVAKLKWLNNSIYPEMSTCFGGQVLLSFHLSSAKIAWARAMGRVQTEALLEKRSSIVENTSVYTAFRC